MTDLFDVQSPAVDVESSVPERTGHAVLGRVFPLPGRGEAHQFTGEVELVFEVVVDGPQQSGFDLGLEHRSSSSSPRRPA